MMFLFYLFIAIWVLLGLIYGYSYPRRVIRHDPATQEQIDEWHFLNEQYEYEEHSPTGMVYFPSNAVFENKILHYLRYILLAPYYAIIDRE